MIHNSKCQLSPMSLWLPLILVSIVLALLMPAIAGAAMTKTFSYALDATLESRYSNYNFGYEPICYVDGMRGSGGERTTLLYFNISSLPRYSEVLEATIYLRINDPSKDTFYAYALKKDWVESEATWTQASDYDDWYGGGASSLYDRYADGAGTLYAPYTGTAKIYLDPDAVERWLRSPQYNFGVVIASSSRYSSDRIGFYSSDASQSSQRPKLVIEYR
jgi:hypothetical protein